MIKFAGGGSPDTQPPSVQVTSPTPGQTLSGTVTVTAAASDNVSVSGVQFKADGSNIGAEDTTAPYSASWDTALLANGSHTLTATARDPSGNQNTSSPVTVTTLNSLPPVTGGLVLAYSFNEGSGSTAADSSGSSRTGTISGAAWTASGKYSNALSFDGLDDKVSVPSSLDITLPFTIEAWIYPTSYADWRAILSKRDTPSSSDMRLDLGLSSGTGSVYIYTGSAAAFSYIPPLNTWTHLALAGDSAGTRLYVNGALSQTLGAATPGTDPAAKATVGNTGDDDDPFAGRIDEVRVYSRALSQAEIQSDMSTPIGGQQDTTPPVISGVSSSATSNGATITWTTDDPSDSQVDYGLTISYGSQTTTNPNLVTSHSQALAGLSPSTLYHYRVRSRNSAGNLSISGDYTFTTTIQDTQAPSTPTGLTATPVSSSQINLAWTASTDNVGVAGYRIYRNGSQVATSPINSYSDTGLSPTTMYSYRVAAYDAAGNVGGQSAPAGATTQAGSGFDITINTWVEKDSPGYPTSLPDSANKHVKMAYNSNDHKIYITGGDYSGGVPGQNSHEEIYSYNVAANTWTTVLSWADACRTGFPIGRCSPGWAFDTKRNVFWFGMGQSRQHDYYSNPCSSCSDTSVCYRSMLQDGGLWTFDPTEPLAEKWHREGPGIENAWDSDGTPNVPAGGEMGPWFMYYDPVNDCLWSYLQQGDSGSRYVAKYSLSGITIKNHVSKDNWSYTNVPATLGGGPSISHRMGAYPWSYDTKRGVFYVWVTNQPEDNPKISQMWKFTPYATNPMGGDSPAGTWVKLYESQNSIAPMRAQYGMAYDSVADRVLLFAGTNDIEGMGTYIDSDRYAGAYVFNPNDNTITYLTVSGTIPDGRKGESLVYDSYNNVFAQLGGRGWDTTPDTYGFTGNEIFLLRLSASNTTAYHRADNNQDCIITQTELSAFITLWHQDSSAYPMRELIDGIAKWKSGSAC